MIKPSLARTLHAGWALALFSLTASNLAGAVDSPDDAGSALVVVNGTGQGPDLDFIKLLPDKSSPQTYLTSRAIEELASPFSDYGTLANLTPSYVSSAPNGNGFDAAKNQTLRGFADGQFNVTLDGIPFADPDSFTHHSTSYFPAATLDHLLVDRSPGSATTPGYATIGGSINLNSALLPSQAENTIYGAYGSFATTQVGARFSSAKPTEDGQTGYLINVEQLNSNGALSYASGRKDDLLLKTETLLGTGRLTLLLAYDRYEFYNPPSVTTAQIAQFGSGFGFTNKPGTPDYYAYNATARSSDFAYARFQTSLGAWQFDNKLYTYAYYTNGLSPKGDSTASPIGSGYNAPPGDIAGRVSVDKYRTTGNLFNVEHADANGIFRGGLWLEHSAQEYYRNALDLTSGLSYNLNRNAGSAVVFNYGGNLTTVQPFAEYEWLVTSALKIRPGVRDQRVTRDFDATVVPNYLPGTNGTITRTVSSILPSLDVRYAFSEQVSAYAQGAKGVLVPGQSFFYTANPHAGNQVQPETSRSLQTGLTAGDANTNLSADIYQINLNNYFSSVTQNGNTTYLNDGAVRYRGLELEGGSALGAGLRVIGNVSLMRAQFQQSGITAPTQMAGDDISFAPRHVGLLGILYHQAMWSGSLLSKFIGSEYQGKNGSADGPNYRVGAYSYTNLTIARELSDLLMVPRARLSLTIDNLQNKTPVTDVAGPSAAGPLEVNVLAKRNFLLAFSVAL